MPDVARGIGGDLCAANCRRIALGNVTAGVRHAVRAEFLGGTAAAEVRRGSWANTLTMSVRVSVLSPQALSRSASHSTPRAGYLRSVHAVEDGRLSAHVGMLERVIEVLVPVDDVEPSTRTDVTDEHILTGPE